MKDLMAKFTTVAARPYDWLREWKETHDKKLMGVAPMHFPEEIVHAAGMQPVVLQESDEPITFGDAYVHPHFCAWTRSNIDLLVKEKLNFFDGLLFFDECLQSRGVALVLRNRIRSFPYYRFLETTLLMRGLSALAAVTEEYERLRSELQEFVGHEITDESLRDSVLLYNKNRGLLRKLYDLRRAKPSLLRARDILAVVHSAMIMPKEDLNELLEALLAQLEKLEAPTNGKVRLILSGHLCTTPKNDFLDLIEGAGAVIVDDDLYTGYGYFATDAPLNGNPMEALAKRYLTNMPPSRTRWDPDNQLGEYLVEMVRRNQAQGVITLQVKHCESHHWYYPSERRILEAAGIPQLLLQTDHEIVSLGPERTRIEAFVEMIRAGAPA